jgi:hypothetical protein
LKCIFLIPAILLLSFCRKKTDITITVFNPYIQQYVKDAKVSVLELRHSNYFTSGWGRRYDRYSTIASGTTNDNGVVVFNNEKLRSNSKFEYVYRITEAWGSKNTNTDPAKYDNIRKGKANDFVICDYTKGTASVRFSNLFVPAQQGDSLSVLTYWYDLYDPFEESYIKGDGIYDFSLVYDPAVNLPVNYSFSSYPDQAGGKVLLTIRKRKLGVLTLDTVTVQFYPKKTTVIPINW